MGRGEKGACARSMEVEFSWSVRNEQKTLKPLSENWGPLLIDIGGLCVESQFGLFQ
jgi:hypothetical protein